MLGQRQLITGLAAAGLLLAIGTAAVAVELPYSGTDLTLWLHADGALDLAGGTYPTRIDTWYDHTGVGGNTVAEDGTGKPGNKPDFVASAAAFNNMPVARFDNTSREVYGSAVLPAGSGARTIVIVASSTGTANDILFDPNGQGGTGAGDRLFRVTPEVRTRYGNGNTTPGADTGTPDFSVPTTPVVFGVRVPVVAGGAEQQHVEFFNGTSTVITGTATAPTNKLDTGTAGYRLGGPTNWQGDVAELLVFDSYLSNAELDKIGFYLQQKYALGSSFTAPTDVYFDDGDPTDNNWMRPANWDTAAEPIATQNAFVNGGLTANVTQSGEVANSLTVGSNNTGGPNTPGRGTLNLQSGDLTIGNNLVIGEGSNAHRGTVTQTGGDLSVGGDLDFDHNGNQVSSYRISAGNLDIDGNVQHVGGATRGHFYVDGGTVTIDGNITVQSFRTGDAASSSGVYAMSSNQTLNNTGTYFTGRLGVGQFTMNDAGNSLTVANRLQLGDAGSGAGTFNLIDGAVTVNGGGLYIAGANTNANKVNTTGDFILGNGATSPTVDVNGGNTEVGRGGTGSLTLNSGTFNQNASNFVVAQAAGASGTVAVNDGLLDVANDFNMNRGTGNVSVLGGTVDIGDELQFGNAGGADHTFTVDGGTVIVGNQIEYNNGTGRLNLQDGILDLTNSLVEINGGSGHQFNFTGGMLRDVDIFEFDLVQDGGLLRIGPDSTIDTMDIDAGGGDPGDYDFNAGILEIEIAGAGGTPGVDLDYLDVQNNAFLDGTMQVQTGGFGWSQGQTFDVLTATDINPGTFSLDSTGTGGQWYWSVVPGGNGELLRLTAVVPEPATLLIWSLLAGLGIGVGWRRRSK